MGERRLLFSRMRNVILVVLAALMQSSLFAAAASPQAVVAQVPFVGCKSDGQVGPRKAPAGKTKALRIDADSAQQLAYYKTIDGLAVLAPRGWYCFETYGSSGSSLYVSPEPINVAIVFTDKWRGFAGPAVQLTNEYGGTSGRFGVARVIARVFPTHREFVTDVVNEGIEPATFFPSGPYPKDKLTYKGNELVEYETPSQTEGLGTDSRLQKNAQPIRGVAILVGEDPDLVQLSVRLPANQVDLTTVIIQQVEREAKYPRQ